MISLARISFLRQSTNCYIGEGAEKETVSVLKSKMPLPAALQARLEKRGIVKRQESKRPGKKDDD